MCIVCVSKSLLDTNVNLNFFYFQRERERERERERGGGRRSQVVFNVSGMRTSVYIAATRFTLKFRIKMCIEV